MGTTTTTTSTTTTASTSTTTTVSTTTTTTTTTTTVTTTTAAADLRRTCNTVSGPSAGKPCVFPFTRQGKTFNSCTKEGDDQGKPWSTTMVDQAGNHITGQGQYGFCSQACNQGLRRV